MSQPFQQPLERYPGDRDSSSSEDHQSTSDHMSQGSSRPFGASRDSSHSILGAGNYPERPLIGGGNHHRRQSSNFDDLTPEILGLSSQHSNAIGQNYSRYSSVPSRHSVAGLSSLGEGRDDDSDLESAYGRPAYNRSSMASFTQGDMVRASTTDALLWDEKNMEGRFRT